MTGLLKKELYFLFTEHWLTIIIAVFILIFTSSYNTSQELGTPTIALLNNEMGDELQQRISDNLNVKEVNSIEKGKEFIKTYEVDAFVYSIKGEIIILKNDKNVLSHYVKPYIQSSISDSPINLVYVKSPDKEITFGNLFFMFALVCFAVPPLLFKDDKNILNQLLLTPVKKRYIVLSKFTATSIVLFLLTLLYLYLIDNLLLSLIVYIFLVGLIYVALGTFFGVLAGERYFEYLTYPVMIIVMIVPLINERITELLNSILRSPLLLSYILSLAGISLFIILITIKIFKIKIRGLKE